MLGEVQSVVKEMDMTLRVLMLKVVYCQGV